MYGHVSNEGALETQEQRTERRLELEARGVNLGTIRESPTARGDTARVEVTYRPAGDPLEHAGFFLVQLVEIPAELLEGMSEAQQLENHPATKASELVLEELERRYPDADYVSVDDTYAE